MVSILSQATVSQEFNQIIPVDVSGSLRTHICGGQAELHRYTAPAEKTGIALGAYNPLQDTTYAYPGLQNPASVIDLSYVQVFVDNAYLQYYQDLVGGGDVIAPVAGFANRVRASATNWAANGSSFPRAAGLFDRDVQVGDAVFLQGGGDTLWTTVAQIVADSMSGAIASAVPDPGDAATQGATTSQSQTGGSSNFISLTSIGGANYDGSATGDLAETYTLVVTTPSVGGDATTARLSVSSASGRDNQATLIPASFGTAFLVGTRGLKVTFTNTNTGNSLTLNAPPIDFIVGQTWQVTVQQAWTAPVATSGGAYLGTTNLKYLITVTRGGLYQNQQPVTPPSVVPTVNPTGGGAVGGLLQAGTYYAKYTFVNAQGESTPSPESAQFTVAAGNIPQVTLPALPANVTSINLYLTPTNGGTGTEVQYTTGIVTTTVNCSTAVSQEPPVASGAVGVLAAPTVTPTVNPTGGGAGGGALQTGTFYLKYTFTNASGETAPSPESLQFTVAAGNQPQVTLPALPAGATGISIYITPPGGNSGSEVIRYATGVNVTTYTMAAAAPKLPPTTNSTSPVASNPAFTPTVNASGGGASGGKIPAGTYYLKVTYNGTAGETLAGPESAQFTVAAGNIPQITNMPGAAPSNVVTFNVYVTPVNGAAGSEVLYASAQAFPATTFNLATAFPTTAVAPPGSNTTNPVVVNPVTTPTVATTGGGATGGLLPPGAYFVKYTFSGKAGETQASPESTTFTVAAGNIPQVTLPTLPANVTGINLYVTQPAGGSGTEILYAQGITTPLYNLSLPMPVQTPPPGPNTSSSFTPANPSVAPTVNPTGGGATGGKLTAGVYKLEYTFLGNANGETLVSTEVTFTIAVGNIPQVTVPALPSGISGVNIYLTQPGGASGSETKLPSAANSPGPTISLNASSLSALVLPPPTVNGCTALATNPNPPQLTITTDKGTDTAGPTNVTAAATPVAVGALGVTIQFTGTGLRKGDLYSVQTSSVSAGPFRTLVLKNNLSAAMQGASDLGITLYIKQNITVPIQRLSAPPAVNYIASTANLILKAGMTAFQTTLTNSGVPFAVPVVSGLDTVVYLHYRAWLPTYAQQLVGTAVPSSSDPLTWTTGLLGTVDPDNPLAYGLYKALLNANGQTLYFSSPGDPSVVANWQGVLAILVGLKNIRQLVPLSVNPLVLAAYQAHVDTQSNDAIGGEWRSALFNLQAVTTTPIVVGAGNTAGVTPTTSDGQVALATVINNPLLSGTNYTYLTCTTRNAKFVTNAVQPGDVVRINFTQDAFGNPSFASFVVSSIINEDTLVLVTGPASAIATATRIEVWRNLTPTQVAGAMATIIKATADKRIVYVWPDFMLDGGKQVAGMYLCAAIGGLLAGMAPHQGLRYLQILGFDGSVPRSTQFFNNAQLQTLFQAGAVVVTSDLFGNVFALGARTTDQSGTIDFYEELVVRINDALKYMFYLRNQQFFGTANVTPTLLNMVRAETQSAIQLAKQSTFINRIGALLVDGSINTLKQSSTRKDQVVLIVNVVYNYPDNDASVSLLLGT